MKSLACNNGIGNAHNFEAFYDEVSMGMGLWNRHYEEEIREVTLTKVGYL